MAAAPASPANAPTPATAPAAPKPTPSACQCATRAERAECAANQGATAASANLRSRTCRPAQRRYASGPLLAQQLRRALDVPLLSCGGAFLPRCFPCVPLGDLLLDGREPQFGEFRLLFVAGFHARRHGSLPRPPLFGDSQIARVYRTAVLDPFRAFDLAAKHRHRLGGLAERYALRVTRLDGCCSQAVESFLQGQDAGLQRPLDIERDAQRDVVLSARHCCRPPSIWTAALSPSRRPRRL